MDFTALDLAGFVYREADYLSQNPDVGLAVSSNTLKSGFSHFVQNGFREGRSPSRDYELFQGVVPFFDETNYLAANLDVQNVVKTGQLRSGLEHFARYGFREGREPGAGFDRFMAGTDNADSLTGGLGKDLIFGLNGDDDIRGLDGNDRLFGNRDRDRLFGNGGNDWLRGGKGNDSLWGGTGTDTLFGDLGDDVLSGDLGADTLSGGGGDDWFVVPSASGGATIADADVITDFQRDGFDRLVVGRDRQLTDLEFTAGTDLNSGDTIMRDRVSNRYLAVLKGVSPGTLDAGDLLFADISPTGTTSADSRLRFSSSSFQGIETDGSAIVTIERSGNLQTESQVNLSTGSGTATPNQDFTPLNSTLTFAPGEASKTVRIALADDRLTEPSETVELLLSNPVGAQLDRAQATLTISDSGSSTGGGSTSGMSTVAIDGSSYSINETGGSLSIPVRRTGDLSQSLSVNYSTANGSAQAGSDYQATAGQLVFAAGQSLANVVIPIAIDAIAEPTETFQLTLSDVTNGQLGSTPSATIAILDGAGGGGTTGGGTTGGGTTGGGTTSGPVQSSIASAVTFSPSDTEAAIAAKNGPKVTLGNTTVYIGYQQVSSANKDPILVSFTNGVRNWVRTDYETTNDDGTGDGLAWDGSNLYAVFSSTGEQPGNSLSRFTGSGWLRGYTDGSPGGGGGGKVGVLAKVDLTTGNIQAATYLTARNDRATPNPGDDRTNSLFVRGLSFTGGNVVVQADSAYAPRRPDKTSMTQSPGNGALPASTGYSYEVVLSPTLGSALSTRAKDFV